MTCDSGNFMLHMLSMSVVWLCSLVLLIVNISLMLGLYCRIAFCVLTSSWW